MEKPITKSESYKPIDKLPPKGTHDLGTIYRDDYKEKPMPEPCPILKMPIYPKKIHHPHQHLVYNKNHRKW